MIARTHRVWIPAAILAFVTCVAVHAATAGDWPQWRGPEGNAVAGQADPPLRWGANENVAWKTTIPGEGSSSPVVSGERVFVFGGRQRKPPAGALPGRHERPAAVDA